MSVNVYKNKQNVVYPYHEILFSHKNELDIAIWYDRDKPLKHCTKWKKSSIKDYKSCDFLHIKFHEWNHMIWQMNIQTGKSTEIENRFSGC